MEEARSARSTSARLVAIVVAVGIAALTAGFADTDRAALGPEDAAAASYAPSSGVLWGIASGQRGLRTWQEELEYLEVVIGRRYAIDHRYYKWDVPFPGIYEAWTTGAGRIPLLTWVPRKVDGTWIEWRVIAGGAYDALIRERERALRDVRAPIMLTFHHEPDTSNWPPSDYVAAWRRVVDIFRAQGATNVSWVWNLMAYTFAPGGRDPEPYYPGNSYVDWMAADGYNWFGSNHVIGPWRSFA